MWTFAQEEFCQDGNEPVQRGFESPRHALSSINYWCFYFFRKNYSSCNDNNVATKGGNIMGKKVIFYAAAMGIIMTNIIVLAGGAGLLSFGVYQLSSFLGLMVDAPRWKYALTGAVYLVCNGPFVVMEVKDTIEKFEDLIDWM